MADFFRSLDAAVGRMNGKPASAVVRPVEIVHLLALRPELRDSFPVADAVDMAVRAGV